MSVSAETAITIDGVSKVYSIYDRPEDRLKQILLPSLGKLVGRNPRQYYREFRALDDISLDIARGETIGIIGRNGSGKSTLLQTVCGTLSPSAGSVQTHGRIAALLELGSGFNPDFTGRENVYMNAAILGLSQEEVDSRFDDIAAFADIGDFIEQPVKVYSSGMMVRLAFAVIAHVDADILVVDEALSVGDALFNQKCMRFIRSFQERGTLLFVSHDMSAVQNLCEKVIWLAQGRVQEVGDAREVAESYLKYTLQEDYGDSRQLVATSESDRDSPPAAEAEPDLAPLESEVEVEGETTLRADIGASRGWKTGSAELLGLRMAHTGEGEAGLYRGGEKIRVSLEAIAHEAMANPILGFLVRDRLAQDLFGENTLSFSAEHQIQVSAGQRFRAEFEFKLPLLPNGQYVMMASVADGTLHSHVQHHYLHDACVFNVASADVRWGLVGLEFDRVFMEVMDE